MAIGGKRRVRKRLADNVRGPVVVDAVSNDGLPLYKSYVRLLKKIGMNAWHE
jgi:hypothetical protein